jgi:hypothetical protein
MSVLREIGLWLAIVAAFGSGPLFFLWAFLTEPHQPHHMGRGTSGWW